MTKRKILLIAIALFCFHSISFLVAREKSLNHDYYSQVNKDIKANSEKNFSSSTLGFLENKGQIIGIDRLPDPRIKFVFNSGAAQIFVMETGIAYQLTNLKSQVQNGAAESKFGRSKGLLSKKDEKTCIETYRMDMLFSGANPHPLISVSEKSDDYTNYYKNGSVIQIHQFGKVTFHAIYPGIDWVLYLKDGSFKSEFIVSAGADPFQIRMSFKDVTDARLKADGSFELTNRLGSFTEKSPESFQANKKVGSQFIFKKGILSFGLIDYDPKQTLIIDPLLVWSSYYGGANYDGAYSCSTDASGNVYMSGITLSGTGIAAGGYQNTIAGSGYDAYLVKFNSNGVRQWATYFGGIGNERGNCCVTDATGNVYLAGTCTSSTGIASGGHQNTLGGNDDAYLAKFNSSGILQWATYYGGDYVDAGTSCATDASGNVFLSGYTSSTIGIAATGYQNTLAGSDDAFLVKFNSSGVRQWATYYGGTVADEAYSCATDISGNIYLAGVGSSSTGIASGGYQNQVGGGNDAFLAKFNNNGALLWATYYGGNGFDWANACVSDASGNVYMAGSTTSSSSIASGGHQNVFGGGVNYDAFLVKFTSAGLRLWATYYGDSGNDEGLSCTESSGNVYLAGGTTSTNNISFGGYQNAGGGSDSYLVKFNANGIRQWATYYGGPWGGTSGAGCATDPPGNVYLCGATSSGTNIALGGHQNVIGGNYDSFLTKFCGGLSSASPITGNTVVCPGSIQTYSVLFDSNATGYFWSLPGGWSGTSSTNTISTIVGSSGGISIMALNNSCISSSIQSIFITVDTSLVYANASRTVVCLGDPVTLSGLGTNTYTWTGGAVNGVSFSPTATSAYTVTGTTINGCASSASILITVMPSPSFSLNASSSFVCLGKSVTLTASAAPAYTWSTLQTSSVIVVSPSVNTIFTVTGAYFACNKTASVLISVGLLPQLTVSASNTQICVGETATLTVSGANQYSWWHSLQSSSVIVCNPGVTTIYTVTGDNGCKSTAYTTVNVQICTSFDELESQNSINVYPNPNNGRFAVDNFISAETAYITIMNSIGQQVFSKMLTIGRNEISLEYQPPGLYHYFIVFEKSAMQKGTLKIK